MSKTHINRKMNLVWFIGDNLEITEKMHACSSIFGGKTTRWLSWVDAFLSWQLQHFLNFAEAKQSCYQSETFGSSTAFDLWANQIQRPLHVQEDEDTLWPKRRVNKNMCKKWGGVRVYESLVESCRIFIINHRHFIYFLISFNTLHAHYGMYGKVCCCIRKQKCQTNWCCLMSHLHRIEESLSAPVILYHPVVTHKTWNNDIVLLIWYFKTNKLPPYNVKCEQMIGKYNKLKKKNI